MKTKTYRRAVLALLTAVAIGAGVATQALVYLIPTQSVAQLTEDQGGPVVKTTNPT